MVGYQNPTQDCSSDSEGVRAVATLPEQPCNLSHFLRTLFQHLDEHAIRYCVLHSWENLPEKLSSDLDLAVHPRDIKKLPLTFRGLLDHGYRPVQCLNYAVGSYYFVFVWFEGLALRTAAIDIISEHRRNGLILMPGETLVAGRRRRGLFWIPDPGTEFAYLLAKKTLKGVAPRLQQERLKHLVGELGKPRAEKIAGELFGDSSKELAAIACAGTCLGSVLGNLRKQLWLTTIARNPLNPLRNLLGDTLRRFRRWFQPTGLFVVVLGPDGVGKTSTLRQLTERIGRTFRRHRIFHWRPGLLGHMANSDGPVTDPHREAPRGTLASVAYTLGFFLDYWLGYELVIRSLLARSGLVLFDRYFHDLLVDPRRYRYGGPRWLVRFLCSLVPPPDLIFLVLDAPEEVIFSRKREVPAGELRRQRQGYRLLAASFASAELIKTDQGVEQTVGEACRLLTDYLFERFRRRHAVWLSCTNTVNEESYAEADRG